MLLNTSFEGTIPDSATGMVLDGPISVLPGSLPTSARPRSTERRTPTEAKASPAAEGPWIGCCERQGVVEIHDPRLLCRGREAFCRALVDAAVNRFGARRASVALEASTCRIHFGPGRLDRAEMARRAAAAVHAAIPAVSARSGDPARPEVADREASPDLRDETGADDAAASPGGRMRHAALAGGCLALTIGGIILPGVPTLPFLILTGRHAMQASPAIERWLRRHPRLAAMLAEEESEGTPTDWWAIARMIGLAMLCAAAIWVLHPPLPVVLLLELGLMAVLACWDWLASRPTGDGRLALA